MSAISGIWHLRGGADAERYCKAISDRQQAYGQIQSAVATHGDIAFARNLWPVLPEDVFDRQPIAGGQGRFLLVADVRLDNRAELAACLGLNSGEVVSLSDAALVMHGVERWGEGVVDRLYGDFALAIWDSSERQLILARDPTGQRPLHYFAARDVVAFASMPRALWGVDGVPRAIDERRVAELVAELRPPAAATHYDSIKRVPSGHVVRVTADGTQTRRYWDPPIRELRLASDDHYVAALRERIDRAVEARLRGADGLVASHLSAGYDSSTVTATAARLLQPSGKVLAFTSAPRAGFDGDVPRGRVADESPYAAVTAALYSNVEHIVVRSTGTSQLSLLDRAHELAQYPVGQLSNNIWWSAINEEASRRGARVLLTGQVGNHTFSASGLGLLADLIRQGKWVRWWKEARLVVKKGPARWRGVLANSFGPWMPKPLWIQINALMLGASTRANTPYLLVPHWAREIDNSINPGRDTLPPKNSYALRLALLQSIDPGAFRKAALAGWGIEERDPTADRALIEFCLSLPHDQLIKDGITRPLARRALADRLPHMILEDAPRGYQMADWHEALGQEEARREVERVERCPVASSIINVATLRAMVENWPQGNWNGDRIVQEYRFGLLIALSAAHFIRNTTEAAARP